MATNIVSDQSAQKLSFREKMSFFWVNLGNIPISAVISSFLLIFYVDVVGLDPAAVGTLFIISRVIDGVNDPLMGFLIDRLPSTKLGRFRTYLILGSIVCGINFIVLWLGPSLATSGKLAIAYVSYLLFGITFDFMDIPLNSLIPVITSNEQERTNLSAIKGVGYSLGFILVGAATIPIVEMFPTPTQGWHTIIIIYTVIVIVLSLIGTLGIKERIAPLHENKFNLKQALDFIIKTKPVGIMFLTILLFNTGSGITTSSLAFYATYYLGDSNVITMVFLMLLVGTFLGIGILPAISKKYSKKTLFLFSIIGTGVATALIFIVRPGDLVLLYVLNIVRGFTGGMNLALSYSIQADNIDYVEFNSGYRAEASLASIFAFITKTANGVGQAIPGYVLAFTGYIANAANQSGAALLGIRSSSSLIPGFLFLISIIAFMGYPLTKDMLHEVNQSLIERRSSSSSDTS